MVRPGLLRMFGVAACSGAVLGLGVGLRDARAVGHSPAAAAGVGAAAPAPIAHESVVITTPTPAATSAPTAVSTPLATRAPSSRPAIAPARRVSTPRALPSRQTATPPPAPPSHRYWLTSGDGTLSTGVGTYSDCSGNTPLFRNAAAIDTCIHDVAYYFVGHNPGVFTPLMHMDPGAVITYWDGSATPHAYRVVATRNWQRDNGAPPPVDGATVQFQTCVTSDGSVDRILDAVPD